MPDFLSSPRILIIKLGALGDFVLATGAMASLRRYHADAHLTLLTTRPLDTLIAGSGWFDDIWIDSRPRRCDLAGWWAMRRRLCAGGFARVYDLQNNDRTALYYHLSTWPGRRLAWSGLVAGCSHRFRPPEPLTHASDWQRAQLAAAGVPPPDDPTLDWLGSPAAVRETCARFGLVPGEYLLLVAGCSPHRPEKRWPALHYAALARGLLAQGMLPVLIGTAAEADVNRRIADGAPGTRDLTGQTTLADLPALARAAAGAVGNDTGPMHLIAPTGCPTLVLFSRHSRPELARPLGAAVMLRVAPELAALSPEDVRGTLERMGVG